MATGKQGFVRSAAPQHLVSAQRGNEMHVQAPLPAMYVHAVPGLPSHPQAQPASVPLSMPMMYANPTLPFLTLHIAGGTGIQQQRPETPASSPRPKSAGKHVCPHCGRDCLKPSVLEKHLRCHTGERPYPCATCGISFKTQSNLYKHKRTQAHARLSSESSTGTFSSQESTESMKEICSSPLLELQREDSGDVNRNDASGLTANTLGIHPAESGTEFNTEQALGKAITSHGQQELQKDESQREELSSERKPRAIAIPAQRGDGHAPNTPNRIPLQRQEALFAKISQGKTQSHDSTDSGFSESSENHLTSSLGDSLHNPSLESVSSIDLPEPGTSEPGASAVSLQEKQKLEEHILKLISDNSVLVDDRHLVNVRPRKTVLSKQGSIDLPTRYTYKDSFHFEIGKHQVSSSPNQDRRGRALYSSLPTQHSANLEHAPLIRSSSLPFSVGWQNGDRTSLPPQVDSVPLSRRCSAGHIYPFSFVDQQTPSHRLLVRQVAVDCLSSTDAERGSQGNLGSDGDSADATAESAAKRCRRKKAQKFPYNKWYMYGGGTFKKLYNEEQESSLKSKKHTEILQRDNNLSVSDVHLPPVVNMLTSQTSSQGISSIALLQNSPMKQPARPTPSLVNQMSDVNAIPIKGTEEAQPAQPVPSERKKQKTQSDLSATMENPGLTRQQKCIFTSADLDQPEYADVSQSSRIYALSEEGGSCLNTQGSFTSVSSLNQRQLLFKRHSSPMFMANVCGASSASGISSDSQSTPSFLPKYQLKIPSCTDSGSDSSQRPSEHPKSAPQSHSVLTVASSGGMQPTADPAMGNPVTSIAFMAQPQNLIYTSATISLTPMVVASIPQSVSGQAQTHDVTPSAPNLPPQTLTASAATTRTPVRPQSHLTGSIKCSQICAPAASSVLQNIPATSVLVPWQQQLRGTADPPVPACQKPMEMVPLEICPPAFPGAEDTFYVQTADLQIVMQLISDEQLAMIEPQIEKPTGGHSVSNFSQERHTVCPASPELVPEHNENSITSSCATYLAKGVISSLCPTTENRLGQCKSLSTTLADGKEESSTGSCLKPRVSEDSSANKPNIQSGPEPKHDCPSGNSTSPLNSMKQCSQDAPRMSHTFPSPLDTTVKATHLPELSKETHHSVPVTAQQHKSVLVSRMLKSVEDEAIRQLQPAHGSSSSSSQEETPLAPNRITSSESVPTSVVCQHRPLKGTICEERLKNETGKHLPHQDSFTQETEAKELTDRTTHKTRTHFESLRSTSECPQEETVKCEQTSGKMHPVSQDPINGLLVNCSLQSSALQQDGGTGSPWNDPQEPKGGGEDAGERVGMPETTGMAQEKCGMGNKGEAAESQPNLSRRVITFSTSSAQPDMSNVSMCRTAGVGRDLLPLRQSDCACLNTSEQIAGRGAGASVVSTLTARSDGVKENDIPGSHDRFAWQVTGPSDGKHFPPSCGHLLAHPLLVNAIQKEVEKETQKKNQERYQSKVSQGPGTPSPDTISHPESRWLRKSTAAHTFPLFSNPTISSITHSKPHTSASHPAEPNTPPCQRGSSYAETEEKSSSSDDEGKLVIELE